MATRHLPWIGIRTQPIIASLQTLLSSASTTATYLTAVNGLWMSTQPIIKLRTFHAYARFFHLGQPADGVFQLVEKLRANQKWRDDERRSRYDAVRMRKCRSVSV